jgi:hypothetical protein
MLEIQAARTLLRKPNCVGVKAEVETRFKGNGQAAKKTKDGKKGYDRDPGRGNGEDEKERPNSARNARSEIPIFFRTLLNSRKEAG